MALLTPISSLETSQAGSARHHSEAVLSPAGKVLRVASQHGGIMRRHDSADVELEEASSKQQMYGVLDTEDRTAKMQQGTAHRGDPFAITKGKWANTHTNNNFNKAPDWAPHSSMPTMATCTADVSQEMGLSDYGGITHSCASCERNCTDENKQSSTNMTWLFEPSLEKCNAFDVKLYANWSNVDQLGCDKCADKGLRHAFEFEFASNAGEGKEGYEDKVLSFKGWMGPEIQAGPRASGSDFPGLHVFEVEDTEEPSHSDNCDAPAPEGRWIAMPGELRSGETFHCERICKSSHPCNCGRNTGMRCTAGIAMSSGQLFSYRIRTIAESANATLDNPDETWVGTEWEVTAEDLTQTSPVMTVGRVVLAGNKASYGIKDMRQSHQHLGCVPCDLFYESTIVSGPFIQDPPGVHAVKSSMGFPPPLTAESCELFRMSSMGGLAVRFETGPGLWPPFEVNDTIFTCDQSGKNTCPA